MMSSMTRTHMHWHGKSHLVDVDEVTICMDASYDGEHALRVSFRSVGGWEQEWVVSRDQFTRLFPHLPLPVE